MKVAVITRLTNPGGIPSCALSLVRGLNARNIVPDLIWDLPPSPRLLEQWGATANPRVIPFRISTLTVQRLPESLRYVAWILNAIDGKKVLAGYDFVYTFNQVYMLEGLRHLYYVAGPPLVPELDVPPRGIRAIPLKVFKWLYRTWLRKRAPIYDYLPNCNLVICSGYIDRLFQKAHGVSLPIIFPPIRVPDRPIEEDLSTRDTVLFFSRIVSYKRPNLMLDIAPLRPNLRWVIMGGNEEHQKPYLEWLQGEAARRGLPIEFIVNPDEQSVRRELMRARFYFFPTINEHFGMTTPEAMLHGAIPLVHNSGGQVEIVPDERLRFEDSTLVATFEKLSSLSESELMGIRSTMLAHAGQYAESVFHAKMLSFLDKN